MIRIYKDNDTKVVTQGAYESFYKPLGYNKVIETKPIIEEPKKEEQPEPIIANAKQEKTVTTYKRRSFARKNKKEE